MNNGRAAERPLLRQINEGKVLAELRRSGMLRIAELADRSGLSRPTVSHIVDELHRSGWVTVLDEHPEGRSGLGRPARLVQFRAEAGFVVGIDIGRHHATVMVADLDGAVRTSARRATSSARDGRELIALVRGTVQSALAEASVPRSAVLSVAVGSPGVIDRTTHAVLQAPGLPGWTSLNLLQELRRSFRCPLQVENDINLAVIGERWRGAAQDAETVVFVQWGERVGAGICLGGRVHPGRSGAAGEIGFLTVLDPDATDAGADLEGSGPFEHRVAAGAIAALARKAAERRGGALAELLAGGEELDTATVFAAAAKGDAVAEEVVSTVVGRMAHGLAALVLVLDPDMLVVGGGISRAGPALLAALGERLRRLTLVPTRLELSQLGEDAVALGAIRTALTEVEERLMPAIVTPPPADGRVLLPAATS